MSDATGGAPWRTAPRLPRPLACSRAALSVLGGAVSCQVEALHASGLVLRAPQGPQLFVSSRHKGLLPLQIILRQADLVWLRSRLQPGMWLSLEAPSALARRCLLGPRAAPTAPCRAAWCSAVAVLQQQLEGRRGGLGMTWRELSSPQWTAAELFSRSPRGLPLASLRWLLGRGEGSTPAGDDMLLGALLALWSLGLPDPPLRRALLALRPEWPVLTTELSITYLQAALEGDFSGHLLSLAEAVRAGVAPGRLTMRVNRALAHGHSSGLDCLLGFLLVAWHA